MDNLYEKTIKLLKATKTPIREIAAKTGITFRYIYLIRDGKVPDPSVHKIQRLHDYLSGDSNA